MCAHQEHDILIEKADVLEQHRRISKQIYKEQRLEIGEALTGYPWKHMVELK